MADFNWHYAQNDQTVGPVTFAALRDLAARGVVQRSTLVWTDGMAEWAAAETVSSLWVTPVTVTAVAPNVIGYRTYTGRDFRYAGFWLRVAAYLIDGILLTLVSRIIFFMVHDAKPVQDLVSIIIPWLYYSLMDSSPRQATLGKIALNLYVTDLNGGRLSFARATGRFFGKILSALSLGIGFMMSGWTARKQALHDMLAGTLVLRR